VVVDDVGPDLLEPVGQGGDGLVVTGLVDDLD
jgi:hypothetical protein